MAPIVFDPEVRYLPILTVAAHLTAVLYMSATVGRGLYRSWQSLPPSQAVRSRVAERTRLVPLFATLAVLGFSVAAYSSVHYATVSYQVWADQRGIESPQRIFWRVSDGDSSTPLYIRRWLSDTAVYQDAAEVVAEKSRRHWWGQQIDVAKISWALLLAIEGRRRGIPFLWAYLSLAHLVNLSFAQNLFYLAMLLTPAPIPKPNAPESARFVGVRSAMFPPKSPHWCPNPVLFLCILLPNFLSVFLLPYAAGTTSFRLLLLSTRVLDLVLVAMPSVVPGSWGTVHPHPHDAYGAFSTLFRVAAGTSFLLHVKSTLVSLLVNIPDPHYHRHSIRIPWDTTERSAWERSTTALGRVLGSTADHPVVAGVGRDVIISALSLGLWAAVRALDSRDILLSAIPFYGTNNKSSTDEAAGLANKEGSAATATQESASERTNRQRGGKTAEAILTDADDAQKAAGTATRRRGRPKKIKPEPEPEPDLEEIPGDQTYRPAEEAPVGDELPAEELDWEAAALAWGLTAVGGLGCGSAAVFGGECISR